ncbi:MAG: DUF3291 domain-containing protein [Pseudomonadota bacterium]
MKKHIAQLNIGRLLAAPGHPMVQEFMDALDMVNGLGKRSSGFVWMMEGSGEPGTGNTENALDGDPQFVANLTVWEDVASLRHFAMNTLHKKFMMRRGQWFEKMERPHFVMWWVDAGHKPTLAEARDRLDHIEKNGDSDYAFGWAYAGEAGLWKAGQETTV